MSLMNRVTLPRQTGSQGNGLVLEGFRPWHNRTRSRRLTGSGSVLGRFVLVPPVSGYWYVSPRVKVPQVSPDTDPDYKRHVTLTSRTPEKGKN